MNETMPTSRTGIDNNLERLFCYSFHYDFIYRNKRSVEKFNIVYGYKGQCAVGNRVPHALKEEQIKALNEIFRKKSALYL